MPIVIHVNFQWFHRVGCLPKFGSRSRNSLQYQTRQRISAASGPKCTILWDLWGRHCCLTSFFPIVNTCLRCEDIAGQSCATSSKWRFFGNLCVLYLQPAGYNTFQTCILPSH